MSLLFFDGFDHYASNEEVKCGGWQSGDVPVGSSTPATRHGVGQWMRTGNLYWGFPATYSAPAVFFIGVAVYHGSSASLEIILYGSSTGSNSYAHLRVISEPNSGVLSAYRGGTGLGSSAGGIFGASTWNYWEVEAKIADGTAGYVIVRKNGVEVWRLENLDTLNNTYSTNVYGVGLYTGTNYDWVDDFYICDTNGSVNNGFLGDVRARVAYPNGAGNYTQWTPSAGNNYAAVDDPADCDDDSTYVATGNAPQTDTYAFPDIVTGGAIRAVQLIEVSRRDDSGSPLKVQGVARISSTDYRNPTKHVLGSSYTPKKWIMETNPANSNAWTDADVNGAEFGIYLNTTTSA